MANPFFDNYFTGAAKALYGRSLGMFKGAKWLGDTPLPTTGTVPSLSEWWSTKCAPLWLLARADPALTAAKNDVNTKLLALVGDPPPGSSKADLGDAALTALGDLGKLLQPKLDALLAKGGQQAIEAVAGFENASLSAVNAAVVAVEAAERKDDILPPSLNETFDEVFLRNASASLWDGAKDPPKGLYFHEEDVSYRYLIRADAPIGSPGEDKDVKKIGFRLGDNCADFEKFDGYLRSGKDENGRPLDAAMKQQYQGQRSTAMKAMAGTIQQLRETTRQFVSKGTPTAQAAVEMSVVAAETMRCVLKMPARGGQGKFEWPDRDNTLSAELHARCKARVREIKEEIDKERKEDPNRQLV